ncbi:DUF4142 domain-containing protein [Aquabacterium sp.]|uniref:DUF4142 domain-containing protein n=1 Tax=Aquabacterium sp. TaxID=1872578 RepID=UPI00248897F3|nr:DUF4142 domain-containing protein [Aquabacterium sp.]MDI1258331.1 DUF4142 domain-containing protein [Aquabacterium sp.]
MKTKRQILGLAGIAVSATLALSACNRQDDVSARTANSADTPLQDSAMVAANDSAASASPTYPTGDASLTRDPGSTMNSEPTSAGVPTNASPTAAATVLNAEEKKFLADAALGGQYELALAQLATANASDSSVKSYAAMLVSDHTMANQKLQLLAQRRNVVLPTTLPTDKQQVIDRLTKLTGPEFDRQFIQIVGLHDHKTDIGLFEKASREAKDNEVREFASSTLPTLRAHLSAAQNLSASLKGGAGA